MTEKLGSFHFVADHKKPFEALEDALSKCGDASNSLIVLPEAFNYGRYYYDPNPSLPKFRVDESLNKLSELANDLSAAFVVGLLEARQNIAYLVEPAGTRLLCHKKSPDCRNLYDRWTGVDPDNPTMYGGMEIGVLICNEVESPDVLLAKMGQHTEARQVLCVPSCLSDLFNSSDNQITNRFAGRFMVLANSRPNSIGCGSFIANARGRQALKELGFKNKLLVSSWEELEKVR